MTIVSNKVVGGLFLSIYTRYRVLLGWGHFVPQLLTDQDRVAERPDTTELPVNPVGFMVVHARVKGRVGDWAVRAPLSATTYQV